MTEPQNQDEEHGEAYEAAHVHDVYEQIASHFSSTRYKPWPIIERFLLTLRPGSIGLDIGCGNGKYLLVNPNIFIIASDRSPSLVKIASQHQPHDVCVADTLALPHGSSMRGKRFEGFDFAICIAVIHHLSTRERRVEGIRCILETLRPSGENVGDGGCHAAKKAGTALIYVWALEQKNSRRGWDEGHEQDVMVPWVMKGSQAGARAKIEDTEAGYANAQQEKTFYRYYHLYRKGELESDIADAGGTVVGSGYEKDNWWAITVLKGD